MTTKQETAQDNVKMSQKGTKLTIEIDLSKNFGPSASGKTDIIASTGGFTKVSNGTSLNLVVVAKK